MREIMPEVPSSSADEWELRHHPELAIQDYLGDLTDGTSDGVHDVGTAIDGMIWPDQMVVDKLIIHPAALDPTSMVGPARGRPD